jgi:penicillin-binding protein 1A
MRILSLTKRFLLSTASTVLTLCIFTLITLLIIASTLPDVSTLNDAHLQVPMKIYSADGLLMGEYGIKKRIPVPFNQIPPLLIEAVLAAEDSRFYDHSGVDMIAIIRASKAVILSGKKVEGASTISMQVARNFFLDRKKTFGRKIREIILALKIDHEFPKNKILEIYLNKIFLGSRAYGVAAAAQVYYGKTLDQLTLPEIAMIAGLPQSPSAHNPLTNPTQAILRRNHVLDRMLALNDITQAQYDAAIRAPVTARYHDEAIALDAPYATETIRQQLYAQFGDRIYEDGLVVHSTINSLYQNAAQTSLDLGAIDYSKRHGFFKPQISLGIYTPDQSNTWITYLKQLITLPSLQAAAVTSINADSIEVLLSSGSMVTIEWNGLSWAKPYLANKNYPGPSPKTPSDIVNPGDVVYVSQLPNKKWVLSQMPQVEGAVLSINPSNGAIEAMVGGLSYALSPFNRATQAIRQAGSSIKPFIYSAALADGKTLATMINDAPIVIADSGENEFWRPHNDTHLFYGMTSLRQALAESRNVVSVRLLQQIGISYTLHYLQQFGFDTSQWPNSLSLALGTAGVTPLSLAQGYTVFANTGYLIAPHLIDSVINQQGQTFIKNNYPIAPDPSIQNFQCTGLANDNCIPTTIPLNQPIAPRAITPQIAYLMTNAMQDVIQKGTGKRALVLKRNDLAGKTGTTNNQVDAWFSGFNQKVETTVWLGFDNNQRSLHEYADASALPIWIDYMKTVLKSMPESASPSPPGIVNVRIDPKTGLLASADFQNAVFEVFRKDFVPTTYTDSLNTAPSQTDTLQTQPTELQSDDDQTPLF